MPEQTQIEKLVHWIIHNIEGEPSQSEGAGDTAIRIMKEQRQKLDRIQKVARQVIWFDWSGHDDDAVAAIDELREALQEQDTQETPNTARTAVRLYNQATKGGNEGIGRAVFTMHDGGRVIVVAAGEEEWDPDYQMGELGAQ